MKRTIKLSILFAAIILTALGAGSAKAVFYPAQLQSFQLCGSGASIGDTTLCIQKFQDISGTNLTMTTFGSQGFGTVEPNNGSQEESVTWTGVTQNPNGTATLTGINSVSLTQPFTLTGNITKNHAGGATFVDTNTSYFYNRIYLNADDPTSPQNVATKNYVDAQAFGGIGGASETATGTVQIATKAQAAASTLNGSIGRLVLPSSIATSTYNPSGSNQVVVTNGSNKIDSNFVSTTTLGINSAKFGGTGVDGALAVSGGTTTLDVGQQSVFIKNYSSISITGTGAVEFKNGHTNGTLVILKSQGLCTLTSTASPLIDASSTGAKGGAAQAASANGNTGNNGTVFWIRTYGGLGAGSGGTNQPGGSYSGSTGPNAAFLATSSSAVSSIYSTYPFFASVNPVYSKYGYMIVGAGGASGGSNGSGTSGRGGNGGSALVLECGAGLNFTGIIGVNSEDGQPGNSAGVYGGSGAGGAGSAWVLYNSPLTANTGTFLTGSGHNGAGFGGGGGSSGSGGTGFATTTLNTEW